MTSTYENVRDQFTALGDRLALANSTESKATEDKLRRIVDKLTTNDAQDFLYYYTARTAYGTFGADILLSIFENPDIRSVLSLCQDNADAVSLVGLTCPPLEYTREEAVQSMLGHADAGFSSVTTAGVPLPFWSSSDGTGALFEGNSPVGGSGIDMSGDMNSLEAYLALEIEADVTSDNWTELVEKNPLYAWFVAEEELAPVGTRCGNGDLTGTNLLGKPEIAPLIELLESTLQFPNPFEEGSTITLSDVDGLSAGVVGEYTSRWCTQYSIPNEENPGNSTQYSRQHFARMWYDLLITSEDLLRIREGVDDPYSWSLGVGCGYSLREPRGLYTGQNDSAILKTASRDLYYIDEGTVLGALSPELLVGGATPQVGNYSYDSPLKSASVIQTLYPAAVPSRIVDRVKNCKRPGGPVDLTEEEAKQVLFLWKEAAENAWNQGWDDPNDGEVQFVSFSDDAGVIGSTGRMLREITLSNTTLTVISIVLIAVFSVLFMFNFDLVESRVFVTLVGVSLVVLAFFAAVAMGLLVGIKIQVTIAWTLPFIILGLGVDDMYIVLQAMKEQNGFSEA